MHRPGSFTVSAMNRLPAHLASTWNVTAASTTGAAHLRRWKATHPELGDIATLPELIHTIRSGPRERANVLVTIVLHEAGTGDRVATETIVHALSYIAVAVARTYSAPGHWTDEDALGDVLIDLVDTVADLAATGASAYPIRQIGNRLECRATRRRSVEDRRKSLHAPWDVLNPGSRISGRPASPSDDRTDDVLPAEVSIDAGTELLTVLAHAVANGTLTGPEAERVGARAMLDRPISGPTAGADCCDLTAQKRHQRLIHRLRTAANDIADSYLTAADLSTAA